MADDSGAEIRSSPVEGPAIVLTLGAFTTSDAKTAHGLVRGSERFRVVGVVDGPATAGRDAGELLDGRRREIPVLGSLQAGLEALEAAGDGGDAGYCVVGVATHGGLLGDELRTALLEALEAGVSIVNGLHELAGEDPELAAAAARTGARIVDVRRPPSRSRLHFWSGAIRDVATPRLAVLGTDCAIGKRTTARLLVEACRATGIDAEMIYSGQTGWMQGGRYGFVLDAVPNDFVAGEIEHALVSCARERRPDLMVIEGQASLRNPAGPCGSEFLVSGEVGAVVLQHAPGRRFFEGHEELGWSLPPVDDEIRLITLYGATTLAVALNGEGLTDAELSRHRRQLQERLGIPVVLPLQEGVEALLPVVIGLLDDGARRGRRRDEP